MAETQRKEVMDIWPDFSQIITEDDEPVDMAIILFMKAELSAFKL